MLVVYVGIVEWLPLQINQLKKIVGLLIRLIVGHFVGWPPYF